MPISHQHAIHPKAAPVLSRLLHGLQSALQKRLIGIYLYGSMVAGDFDPDISDIDLVVVMTEELNDVRFENLQRLHTRILDDYPGWLDRLELAYISRAGLSEFRSRASTIGIISPGEPFHRIQAGRDWLISWYPLRKDGIALHGPGIKSLLDPISTDEYLTAVKEHIQSYREFQRIATSKRQQSYIVLTVARGLFTLRHRRVESKRIAAAWAKQRFPDWSGLIDQAWNWRQYPPCDAIAEAPTLARTAAYIDDMLAQIDETAAPQRPPADSAGSMPP